MGKGGWGAGVINSRLETNQALDLGLVELPLDST
jgi:hypothetical protein